MINQYTDDFYQSQSHSSRRSADQLVPLVLELISPKSAVDVGCGVGTWLGSFVQHGVVEVLGIDGDYVDRAKLQIGKDRFLVHDLIKPISLNRRFDLVVCLEVAEHLAEEHASTLVASLTGLGPVILFSAAIPHQGGTNHVNERWPEYWAALFSAKGYLAVDCVRPKIWRNDRVDWFYAQNTLLYVEQNHLKTNDRLRREAENTSQPPLALVHPRQYLDAILAVRLAREIVELVAQDESFIVVDDGQFGDDAIPGRRGAPFLERDGGYWGRPRDDSEAIAELERMRRAGSTIMIFAWPSFWWFEYYSGLHTYLRARFRCVRENDCLVAFDLRTERGA